MDAFRRQVRKRATNRRLYVHRSEVQALTTDPAVVIGGAGAAIAEGVPLDAPEICDLYSRLSAVDGLLARTKASEDREGNIIVHAVIDREWPFRPEDRYGGLWVAWLDLADRLDRSADLLADRLVGGRHRA
jgi:hypothetical protein